MDTLSLDDVNQMITDGDIDFAKYKKLCTAHNITATDDQIKIAIGKMTDDDDDEFIELVSNL